MLGGRLLHPHSDDVSCHLRLLTYIYLNVLLFIYTSYFFVMTVIYTHTHTYIHIHKHTCLYVCIVIIITDTLNKRRTFSERVIFNKKGKRSPS